MLWRVLKKELLYLKKYPSQYTLFWKDIKLNKLLCSYININKSMYVCLSAYYKKVPSNHRKAIKFGTNMHTDPLMCTSQSKLKIFQLWFFFKVAQISEGCSWDYDVNWHWYFQNGELKIEEMVSGIFKSLDWND